MLSTVTARGSRADAQTITPFAFRFQLQDRKIVRGESYLDHAEALEAVGLSE